MLDRADQHLLKRNENWLGLRRGGAGGRGGGGSTSIGFGRASLASGTAPTPEPEPGLFAAAARAACDMSPPLADRRATDVATELNTSSFEA